MNKHTHILPSVFFLLIAIASVLAVFLISSHFLFAYMLLCAVILLTVAIGLSDEDYLPLALAFMIPNIARITSLTIASGLQQSQEIIMTSVLFAVGCSYAYASIVWKWPYFKRHHIAPSIFFLLLSIYIGILTVFLTNAPVLQPVSSWYRVLALLLYTTLAEEFVFRSSILHRSLKVLSLPLAILSTSLLYTSLYASSSSLVSMSIAFVASVLSCVLYSITKRLWPSLVFTMLWRMFSVLIAAGILLPSFV